MEIDKRILSFIEESNVLSYCSCLDNSPHCASCFYSFCKKEDNIYLVFKSDITTKHIQNALSNTLVAGTILPNKNKLSSVKGIQFSGIFSKVEEGFSELKNSYYKSFPFALTMPGELWAIELTYIKMTDNSLGFGKKLKWNKAD
ncbi:MAG: hypothetical protein DWP98_13150 [Bacteroidetes bacterium]|nr:MAG: hypothetical protein DWP98_13150 [Bacteroidota bacterium]MBL1145763.1 hypothetical protein [Bacteroidota bacterium]MCB0803911.1 hypothetical protein [Flavobacteriales bacterium]NOG58557.1 hypothetical protein [Bacteroidota bacterium]